MKPNKIASSLASQVVDVWPPVSKQGCMINLNLRTSKVRQRPTRKADRIPKKSSLGLMERRLKSLICLLVPTISHYLFQYFDSTLVADTQSMEVEDAGTVLEVHDESTEEEDSEDTLLFTSLSLNLLF